jgi:NAD pyrophosphatase/5'-nucleotidase NadN
MAPLLALALLFAPGCGSDTDEVKVAGEAPTFQIAGIAADGAIEGAKVAVVDAKGNTWVSSTLTNATGEYSINIPTSATPPFRVRIYGGGCDHGANPCTPFAGEIWSALPAGAQAGQSVSGHVSPITSLIYQTALARSGGNPLSLTTQDLAAAESTVMNLFSMGLDFNPTDTPPAAGAGRPDQARFNKMVAYRAAVRFLLHALENAAAGTSADFDAAVRALALDLADGALDGHVDNVDPDIVAAMNPGEAMLAMPGEIAQRFADRADALGSGAVSENALRDAADALFNEAPGMVDGNLVNGAVGALGPGADVTAAVQRIGARPFSVSLVRLGAFHTGVFDESAAEIVAHDPATQRLFVVNGDASAIDVLSIANPSNPTRINQISVTPYGGGVNSCAFKNGVLAAAVEANTKQGPGKVVLFDADGVLYAQYPAGALPDMVTFSPDGKKILAANEGEPNDDYSVDPEGSVTILDITNGADQAIVTQAGFGAYTDAAALRGQGIRIYGPGATPAQDLEPEYIAVSPDSSMAYVACQENNAIAEINLATGQVTGLFPLGFKNHNTAGNGLDASDKDNRVNIVNWPVYGMYQPDSLYAYAHAGQTYLVSANEGDSRDYDTFSEEKRVKSLSLDPAAFPNGSTLKQDANLGRLTVTNTLGDTNGDGNFEALYTMGARSFSIWKRTPAGVALVYDSGDQFEKITSQKYPLYFNSGNDESAFDDRSDNKGPEPEALCLGTIHGRTFAFVGLERMGGIFVYDVTLPERPVVLQYINNRDYTANPGTEAAGDLGPEGFCFIPAGKSPTGKPMLAVASEISGTTTLYSIETAPALALSILHTNDVHSHLEPVSSSLKFNNVSTTLDLGGMPRLAQKVKDARAANPNTLFLSAGDEMQGTLFFTQYNGLADAAFMNLLKYDAMVVGNHEFDRGPGTLAGFLGAVKFPVLGANVDAGEDPDLSGKIKPYVIKTVGGSRVGIIGLVTEETDVISSPGPTVAFLDAANTARQVVAELKNKGVNKIIVLSHLGYTEDTTLAQTVADIDIIIGGHSHTLLGSYASLGLAPAGPYPTVVNGPGGAPVYIVQAWEWAKGLGMLDCLFDFQGNVLAFRGQNTLLAGDVFKQKNQQGATVEVDAATKAQILALIEADPEIEVAPEDQTAKALLGQYTPGIEALEQQVIGQAAEDLLHVRIPGTVHAGTGQTLANGSQLATLVAESALWKVNSVGQGVTLAIQNAGGVRIDIPAGDITVATAYTLLPFGNTLVVLELTGAQVRQAIEDGVTKALAPSGASTGAWPYLAGARYSVNKENPAGSRVESVEIKDAQGNWTAISLQTVYRVVVNNFLATGGDGYTTLGAAAGYRYDTGFVDAEAFMGYVQHVGALSRPASTSVTSLKQAAFAVFSDPHYYDTALGTTGAAFQQYLAMDRKLIAESEAILDATLDGIAQDIPHFVIVSGDLTKDGENQSHQELAQALAGLETLGTKVYVVPGNHDINNPHAFQYNADGSTTPAPTVTPAEFKTIYNAFGFGEAIATDADSLSYVVQPMPWLRIVCMDSAQYANNIAQGHPQTSGAFSQATLDWIQRQIQSAAAGGYTVFGVMHHGAVEHFTGQSSANPGAEYVISDWQNVAAALANAGMPAVFTGHYHANDITKRAIGQTFLFDIETGSTVTYPCPWRSVVLDGDAKTMDITTHTITGITYNPPIADFPAYARNYLQTGMTSLATMQLAAPQPAGYSLDVQTAAAMAPEVAAAFMAHYAGDEAPVQQTLATLQGYMADANPVVRLIGQMLMSLWTDLAPADNTVELNLLTGAATQAP